MATNYSSEWYQAYASGFISYQDYQNEHTRTAGQFPTPPGIGTEEELGLVPAYYKSLAIAKQPTFGPAAERLGRQFAPTREAFLGATAARGGAAPTPGMFPDQAFTDFMTALGGPSTSNIGRASQSAFNALMGALQNRSSTPLTGFQEQYGLPSSQEQFGGGAALARQAAAGRMGGAAAQYLVPDEGELYRKFLQRNPMSGVEQWLPWLNQYLGLDR